MGRKVVYIILLFFSVLVLLQCIRGRGWTYEVDYKIVDFEINENSYDSEYRFSSHISDSFYVFDSSHYFGFETGFTIYETEERKIAQNSTGFGFVQELKADPSINYYKLINPIDGISIITLNDFDSSHRANSLINDYFLFSYHRFENKSVSDSLPSLFSFLEKEYSEPYSPIHFKLIERPRLDSVLKLKVFIYFRDSTFLSNNTIPMIIK